MTNPEMLSIIVRCKYVSQTNTVQLQIVDVSTSQDIRLREGTFLLRISTDERPGVVRCFIRHIASGRETHIQGGARLREFVKACLLDDTLPLSTDPDSTGG